MYGVGMLYVQLWYLLVGRKETLRCEDLFLLESILRIFTTLLIFFVFAFAKRANEAFILYDH